MKQTRNIEMKFAPSQDDAGVLVGYGSVYGNVDSAGDIIAPGAFAKSVNDARAGAKKFPFLWSHSWDDPIGVIDELSEDRTGLKITVRLNLDTQRGREARSLIQQGAVSGLSVGFQVVKDEVNDQGVRTIKEAKLWEVSAVVFPCNEQAQITSVKAQSPANEEAPMANIQNVILKLNTLKSEVTSLLEELEAVTKGVEDEPQTPVDGETGDALVQTEAEDNADEPLADVEATEEKSLSAEDIAELLSTLEVLRTQI